MEKVEKENVARGKTSKKQEKKVRKENIEKVLEGKCQNDKYIPCDI